MATKQYHVGRARLKQQGIGRLVHGMVTTERAGEFAGARGVPSKMIRRTTHTVTCAVSGPPFLGAAVLEKQYHHGVRPRAVAARRTGVAAGARGCRICSNTRITAGRGELLRHMIITQGCGASTLMECVSNNMGIFDSVMGWMTSGRANLQRESAPRVRQKYKHFKMG
jgi:hypothetical protein